jgi:hypothetical protein
MFEGSEKYLRYATQAPTNKRDPSKVLITPILRLKIEVPGFFVPFMA